MNLPLKSHHAVAAALSAFTLWGVLPVYWKQLGHIDPLEVYVYRALFTALLLLIVAFGRHCLRQAVALVRWKNLPFLVTGALAIAANWYIFIWALSHDCGVEAGLGYLINPIFNILFGMIFLRERLTVSQWVSVALASAGILFSAVAAGHLPWISILLALSMSVYALTRKLFVVDAANVLLVEKTLIVLPCLAYVGLTHSYDVATFFRYDHLTEVLLVASGVVTALPLLLFVFAAQGLPMHALGMYHYLSPTLQLFLAIWVYGESFDNDKFVVFGFIWAALIAYNYAHLHKVFVRNADSMPTFPSHAKGASKARSGGQLS